MEEQEQLQDLPDIVKDLENEIGDDPADYELEETKERASARYNKMADGVWARCRALNLPANNEVVRDVFEHLQSGRVTRAEAKVARLEAVRAKEIDTRAEEMLAEELGKRGIEPKYTASGMPIPTEKKASEGEKERLRAAFLANPTTDPRARAEWLAYKKEHNIK